MSASYENAITCLEERIKKLHGLVFSNHTTPGFTSKVCISFNTPIHYLFYFCSLFNLLLSAII